MDVALFFNGETFTGDVLVVAGALGTDDSLETAVFLSIFSDRRADAGDDLPPGETWRRGYALEGVGGVAGDRFGSKFWLRRRLKQTEETRLLIEQDARDALAWLIEDQVAKEVQVEASWVRMEALGLVVRVARPDGRKETHRWQIPWNAQAEKRS